MTFSGRAPTGVGLSFFRGVGGSACSSSLTITCYVLTKGFTQILRKRNVAEFAEDFRFADSFHTICRSCAISISKSLYSWIAKLSNLYSLSNNLPFLEFQAGGIQTHFPHLVDYYKESHAIAVNQLVLLPPNHFHTGMQLLESIITPRETELPVIKLIKLVYELLGQLQDTGEETLASLDELRRQVQVLHGLDTVISSIPANPTNHWAFKLSPPAAGVLDQLEKCENRVSDRFIILANITKNRLHLLNADYVDEKQRDPRSFCVFGRDTSGAITHSIALPSPKLESQAHRNIYGITGHMGVSHTQKNRLLRKKSQSEDELPQDRQPTIVLYYSATIIEILSGGQRVKDRSHNTAEFFSGAAFSNYVGDAVRGPEQIYPLDETREALWGSAIWTIKPFHSHFMDNKLGSRSRRVPALTPLWIGNMNHFHSIKRTYLQFH
ncbi:uncharacterized protein BDR25DRAFT_362465 [Lindgomyces ingoldianus]|uniref:Uncharacterized protein n=1 Tax=Lindgomyces ingoldianus TaxID=673940 RepID=A0ACB6QA08_9PLEO|nr:uncharacterized protein BDR25DRAFT_362465 [Lindgomyces ingoldianus]KAF2463789.1 hypothetical protein BDR25DRAFT_362465 [Lindgomyces ingoldianus]